jgi:hypothetical protein
VLLLPNEEMALSVIFTTALKKYSEVSSNRLSGVLSPGVRLPLSIDFNIISRRVQIPSMLRPIKIGSKNMPTMVSTFIQKCVLAITYSLSD